MTFSQTSSNFSGVTAESVYPDTFESKLCGGLYIVGETLDIDGECGGYNLTFAFISGIFAAKAVKKAVNKEK